MFTAENKSRKSMFHLHYLKDNGRGQYKRSFFSPSSSSSTSLQTINVLPLWGQDIFIAIPTPLHIDYRLAMYRQYVIALHQSHICHAIVIDME